MKIDEAVSLIIAASSAMLRLRTVGLSTIPRNTNGTKALAQQCASR
jgi:hypothetical protein